jgi:protein required for attachment to host cells
MNYGKVIAAQTPPRPATRWVLVADRTRARVFDRQLPPAKLWLEIHTMVHPAGRLRSGSINADKPGRAFDSMGGGRHALSPQVSPEQHEAETFAGEISQWLEQARIDHRFTELWLLAPPAFLGVLRKKLTVEARRLVVHEEAKDVAGLPLPTLLPHLAGAAVSRPTRRL